MLKSSLSRKRCNQDDDKSLGICVVSTFWRFKRHLNYDVILWFHWLFIDGFMGSWNKPIYAYCRHAQHSYGPWAKCGPKTLSIWPAKNIFLIQHVVVVNILLLCVKVLALEHTKFFVRARHRTSVVHSGLIKITDET